jgi:hypothetical protein
MGADQIAEIVLFVREVYGGGENLCATIEVEGNADAWLQVMAGTLNLAYPPQSSPSEHLSDVLALLPKARITEWEPGTFVTISFGPVDAQVVARAADRLLARLFSLGDYSVNGSMAEI